jgi:multidrug efflux pump
MRGLARFSIANPAFNHVLTALIIAVGCYALITIPQELNPLVAFNWLFVITPYPGASPQEVEQEVTIPLEDEFTNLEDLDFFTSESYEGSSLFFVRFKQMSEAGFDRRIQDVENAINKVDFPEGAEDTDVEEFTSYDLRPVVEVGIYGDLPLRVLNDAAEDIKRQILRIDNIDDVQIFGERAREILVELDPHRMQYFRLSNRQIIDAIRARNLNLPGGILKMGEQEYLVRTQAEFASIDEIAATIVFSDTEGFRVTVGDVATVRDGFSDPGILTRIEGRPSLILTVTKTEQGNSLRVVKAIEHLLEDVRRSAPEGLTYRLVNNSTVEIKHSLNILKSNALMGLVLVLILLYLFLGWRSALAAAIGIPVSFLLTLTFLRFTGETLNQSSLFALVLVLGMVVDDAIVIVENCHTKLHEGKLPPRQAIIEGVSQVARPVIVSSITTIFGFMPLMLMPGIMGRFMRVIPLVVCATLVASLFEAFVILPGHVEALYPRNSPKKGSTGIIRLAWLQRTYVKLLMRCIRHRYLFMIGIVLLLLLSMALAGFLGFDLFAEDKLPSFKVLIQMPTGTPLERTEEVLEQIAEAVSDLPDEELDHISLRAGLIQGAEIWTFLPSVGQVAINLVPHHLRERSVEEIAESVRARVEEIPGPKTIQFQFDSSAPPAGADLQILIKGRHLEVLEEISRDLQLRLKEITGVRDIYDDISRSTRELDVRVDPDRARRYGVTVSQVASELRTAFNGTNATVLHDGDEDIDVVVRYATGNRSQISDVLSTHFRAPSGEMVAFEDIAVLRESVGLSNIRRHNSERAITVRASIDKTRTSLSDAVADLDEIFLDLERAYPGYRISLWGQWKEFIESFRSLGLLFSFGLMLIYLLLVGQFRSLVQPLIILSIVPLSFIGAALGLLVLQRPVTIATMYGLVALAGVAVNDSIVLVDFINNLRKRLADRHQALVIAGQQRLRPVILTSVTTIVGLLPMAIGLGGSTGAWQSLSVTIVSGLVFATVISLFGIPVMISVTDDLKNLLGIRHHDQEEEEAGRIIMRPTTPRPSGDMGARR